MLIIVLCIFNLGHSNSSTNDAISKENVNLKTESHSAAHTEASHSTSTVNHGNANFSNKNEEQKLINEFKHNNNSNSNINTHQPNHANAHPTTAHPQQIHINNNSHTTQIHPPHNIVNHNLNPQANHHTINLDLHHIPHQPIKAKPIFPFIFGKKLNGSNNYFDNLPHNKNDIYEKKGNETIHTFNPDDETDIIERTGPGFKIVEVKKHFNPFEKFEKSKNPFFNAEENKHEAFNPFKHLIEGLTKHSNPQNQNKFGPIGKEHLENHSNLGHNPNHHTEVFTIPLGHVFGSLNN